MSRRLADGACAPGAGVEDQVISIALSILETRLQKPGLMFRDLAVARTYAKLRLAPLEHEAFGAMWLNARHELIGFEELARGTIDRTTVYPREVVKAALAHNAAAAILLHNHPSGNGTPSDEDRSLTRLLRDALALVDVATLDHLIVAAHDVTSLAELKML